MTKMVETVARHLRALKVAPICLGPEDLHEEVDRGWRLHIEEARTAIAAMREPSMAMCSIMPTEDHLDIWRDAIDAALADNVFDPDAATGCADDQAWAGVSADALRHAASDVPITARDRQ